MNDFSTTTPLPERVKVLTEERDGITTGYVVKSVDVREYLDRGGSLSASIGGELREMKVDVIIVIAGADFAFKPHPSIQDCFLIIEPSGRQIPLLYDALAGVGEYVVGEDFVYDRINVGKIEKIVLVTKGVMEVGVPENLETSRSRVLDALQE